MTGESEKDLDKLVKKRFVSLEKCLQLLLTEKCNSCI